MSYFVTPTDPEGYSVTLPALTFNNIDFTALDYPTMMRAAIEYVRTYHRNEFNDFVSSNGFMMLVELMCYLSSVVSNRSDIVANEAFLPTAFTRDAVNNHLNLIGQSMRRQTPATVQILCTVASPVATDIRIPAGFKFNLIGADNEPLIYEIFSAPYDWTSDIVITAGSRGIVAWGIEGSFATDQTFTSTGGENQSIVINGDSILSEPIIVVVDNEQWSNVNMFDKYGPDDEIFTTSFAEGTCTISFGDNVYGKAPESGQTINVRYRIGGGARGRIGTGFINEAFPFSPQPPATAAVQITFRNSSPSNGGYDEETIEEAKLRAPREWSTHDNIVSGYDYSHVAATFRHPVYGGVQKAVATVFTSLNANIVKVSILAEGVDGEPVVPSTGLKVGLRNFLNELNPITDDVEVIDGKIKAVDIEITIVVYRNSDAAFIKEQVDAVIDEFFNLDNWDMGQPLYVSTLYNKLMNINGIRYVNIFKPSDDILASDISGDDTVAYNELITLGSKNIKIYYEKQ